MPEWKPDPDLKSPCVRMERLGIEMHVSQSLHDDQWHIFLHSTVDAFTPIIPELEGELFDTMEEAKTFAEDVMVAILIESLTLYENARKRAIAKVSLQAIPTDRERRLQELMHPPAQRELSVPADRIVEFIDKLVQEDNPMETGSQEIQRQAMIPYPNWTARNADL